MMKKEFFYSQGETFSKITLFNWIYDSTILLKNSISENYKSISLICSLELMNIEGETLILQAPQYKLNLNKIDLLSGLVLKKYSSDYESWAYREDIYAYRPVKLIISYKLDEKYYSSLENAYQNFELDRANCELKIIQSASMVGGIETNYLIDEISCSINYENALYYIEDLSKKVTDSFKEMTYVIYSDYRKKDLTQTLLSKNDYNNQEIKTQFTNKLFIKDIWTENDRKLTRIIESYEGIPFHPNSFRKFTDVYYYYDNKLISEKIECRLAELTSVKSDFKKPLKEIYEKYLLSSGEDEDYIKEGIDHLESSQYKLGVLSIGYSILDSIDLPLVITFYSALNRSGLQIEEVVKRSCLSLSAIETYDSLLNKKIDIKIGNSGTPIILSTKQSLNLVIEDGLSMILNLFDSIFFDYSGDLDLKKKEEYSIYCPDLIKKDGLLILKALYSPRGIASYKTTIKSETLNKITIQSLLSNKKIVIQDSTSILGSEIEKLFESLVSADKRPTFNTNLLLMYSLHTPYSQISSVNENSSKSLLEKYESYCKDVAKTLFKIIDEIRLELKINFQIDLLQYHTISSLAFALFRMKYMSPSLSIPIFRRGLTAFLRPAYYSGFLECYKPYGEGLYKYDINSFYPFIMHSFDLPTGKLYYIKGSNFDIDEPGLYHVEVNCPLTVKRPTLICNKAGYIGCPVGTWTGWYHYKELQSAKTQGYTFKLIEGIRFSQEEKIFTNYINDLYKFKKDSTEKSNKAMETFYKLLLNTLYGRFGIRIKSKVEVINNKDLDHTVEELLISAKYLNLIKINENYTLVSSTIINEFTEQPPENFNVLLAISISALGRYYMSQFLKDENLDIYYIDIGAIEIDKPLLTGVGKELGEMRLVNKSKEAIFFRLRGYGKLLEENSYEFKGSGLTTGIPFEELKKLLLNNNSLSISVTKTSKDVALGLPNKYSEDHSISLMNPNRHLIKKDGKWITEPMRFSNNELQYLPLLNSKKKVK